MIPRNTEILQLFILHVAVELFQLTQIIKNKSLCRTVITRNLNYCSFTEKISFEMKV